MRTTYDVPREIMVDGIGLRVMQRVINENCTYMGRFTAERTKSVAGLDADDKGFLFVFDGGALDEEWQEPKSGIGFKIRRLDRAFYNKKTLRTAKYVGYNEAHGIFIVWNARRDALGTYADLKALQFQY